MFAKRTDLALEAHEIWRESAEKISRLSGVKSSKRRVEGYPVTTVEILDGFGADALGKPVGHYITIDLSGFRDRKPGFFDRAARAVGKELKNMIPETGGALVIGLGNDAMTPDAIGPLALKHILITRHLISNMPGQFAGFRQTAVFQTGVSGVTGIESAEVVKGLIERIQPAVVIAIDALASRRRARLCNTIQIADTGILPGSGVGNHRAALDQASMGVPVIAVGVPTVIDAATLAADLLEESGYLVNQNNQANQTDIISDDLREHHDGLMVTPKEIDAQVRDLSKVIGYGINWCLQDLEIPDMAELLS